MQTTGHGTRGSGMRDRLPPNEFALLHNGQKGFYINRKTAFGFFRHIAAAVKDSVETKTTRGELK